MTDPAPPAMVEAPPAMVAATLPIRDLASGAASCTGWSEGAPAVVSSSDFGRLTIGGYGVTGNLSRSRSILIRQPRTGCGQEVMKLDELSCPWCEVELPSSFAGAAAERTCPECHTTWLYEDEPVDLELAA